MSNKDIVTFILQYRRKKAFYMWDLPTLITAIDEAYEDKTLAVSVDELGINGVIVARKFPSERVLFISGVLTKVGVKGVIKKFLALRDSLYPGWTIEGNRREKRRIFKESFLLKLTEKGV